MDIDIDYHKYYNMVINTVYYRNKKSIILEPLSSIFRLILLNFKPVGTKISIINNSIKYNLPGFSQGILRNINGDGREDLHNLYNPLMKSLEWYSIEKNKNEIYINYYEKSIQGLQSLLESYGKDTIIHHTINHYIKMIQDTLKLQNIDKLDIEESPLLDNMKDFWKEEEVETIYQLFQLIENINNNNEKEVYIKVIDDILIMKEEKLNDYIFKSQQNYFRPEETEIDIIIKKSQIAINAADARPSRFVGGERIDAAISEIDLNKRKISLSIKLLEELQNKEAVTKFSSPLSGKNLPFSSLSDKLSKKKEK